MIDDEHVFLVGSTTEGEEMVGRIHATKNIRGRNLHC